MRYSHQPTKKTEFRPEKESIVQKIMLTSSKPRSCLTFSIGVNIPWHTTSMGRDKHGGGIGSEHVAIGMPRDSSAGGGRRPALVGGSTELVTAYNHCVVFARWGQSVFALLVHLDVRSPLRDPLPFSTS